MLGKVVKGKSELQSNLTIAISSNKTLREKMQDRCSDENQIEERMVKIEENGGRSF